MTRKRTRRKHFDRTDHPGMQPRGLLVAQDLRMVQLRDLEAMDALANGTGNPSDVGWLQLTARVARLLAAQGLGADELPALAMADRVLALATPGPDGLAVDLEGLAALRGLVAVADAQREVAMLREYSAAVCQATRIPR